jgi:uncharacterized protein (DUF4415 family)/uncharacterized DUF497 family protein
LVFEWDERKRHRNLTKHRIDFLDVLSIFDEPQRVEIEDTRLDYRERRYVILCPLKGGWFTSPIRCVEVLDASFRRVRQTGGNSASMSDTETISRAVLTTDGRVLVEQADGSYRPAKGQTDWAEVDRISDEELAEAIAADPDDPANDPEFWRRAQLVHPAKRRVTLRLDADLIAWFRAQGRDYQARINAVLRRHYERARDR